MLWWGPRSSLQLQQAASRPPGDGGSASLRWRYTTSPTSVHTHTQTGRRPPPQWAATEPDQVKALLMTKSPSPIANAFSSGTRQILEDDRVVLAESVAEF